MNIAYLCSNSSADTSFTFSVPVHSNSVTNSRSSEPDETHQKYVPPHWTKPQEAVLKAAKNRFAIAGFTGQDLWRKVAQEVKIVKPNVNSLICRVKYKRLELVKETKEGELDATQGLMQMIEPKVPATHPATEEPPYAAIPQNFSEERLDESHEKPLKRQKLSSEKWIWVDQEPHAGKKWTKEDTEKLVRLVNNTEHKKGMWKVISLQMENKTPIQCSTRWVYIKNNYMTIQKTDL